MRRKWIVITAISVLVLALLVLMVSAHRSEKHVPVRRVPVRHVVVSGQLENISQSELIQLVKPLVDGQNFFHVKLKEIAAEVETIAWVAHADVSRVWPDTIAINLSEQQPIAVWNQIGLVNQQGKIFYPRQSSFPADIPNFFAPNSQQAPIVVKNYQSMKAMLTPLKLAPSTIRIDSSNSWEVTLSNNIKLQLGSKDILTKLQHFVKVYSKVFVNHSRTAQVVDLRYPNGMAVQWKK